LTEKLIKSGATAVSHGCYAVLQMRLTAELLGLLRVHVKAMGELRFGARKIGIVWRATR
jgi:hypothetical protein